MGLQNGVITETTTNEELELTAISQRRNSVNSCILRMDVLFTRDFKQRQRVRRREHHRITENPKCSLCMTGREQVDVVQARRQSS